MSTESEENAPSKVFSYAQAWAGPINATYTAGYQVAEYIVSSDYPGDDDVDVDGIIRDVLTRAAQCLRNGVPATFTASELDVVRHLMPAHAVHQSCAVQWVLEMYRPDEGD